MKFEVVVLEKNGQWKAIAQFVDFDYAQDFVGQLIWGKKSKIVSLENGEEVEYDEY